jgi:hypothetical protein
VAPVRRSACRRSYLQAACAWIIGREYTLLLLFCIRSLFYLWTTSARLKRALDQNRFRALKTDPGTGDLEIDTPAPSRASSAAAMAAQSDFASAVTSSTGAGGAI